MRHSNSKNLPYYFYPETKESNWEPPTGTDQETLKKYMERYTTVPDAQARPEGAIRCAHLLVKHNKSRRPSSWKEAEITRTKEEAYEIINAYKTRIDNNETTLRELAVTESDCASARKQGDLYEGLVYSYKTVLIELGASLSKATCKQSLKRPHSI